LDDVKEVVYVPRGYICSTTQVKPWLVRDSQQPSDMHYYCVLLLLCYYCCVIICKAGHSNLQVHDNGHARWFACAAVFDVIVAQLWCVGAPSRGGGEGGGHD
jgi:hypothetical protein